MTILHTVKGRRKGANYNQSFGSFYSKESAEHFLNILSESEGLENLSISESLPMKKSKGFIANEQIASEDSAGCYQ